MLNTNVKLLLLSAAIAIATATPAIRFEGLLSCTPPPEDNRSTESELPLNS